MCQHALCSLFVEVAMAEVQARVVVSPVAVASGGALERRQPRARVHTSPAHLRARAAAAASLAAPHMLDSRAWTSRKRPLVCHVCRSGRIL